MTTNKWLAIAFFAMLFVACMLFAGCSLSVCQKGYEEKCNDSSGYAYDYNTGEFHYVTLHTCACQPTT